MICPFCDFPMNKEKTKPLNFLGKKKNMKKRVTALVCSNMTCKARMSLHPNGTVASVPADKETRALRHRCHLLSEMVINQQLIWKSKQDFYDWMKDNTRYGHIGFMGKADLNVLEKELGFILLEQEEKINGKMEGQNDLPLVSV